jgi:hypothetical protein
MLAAAAGFFTTAAGFTAAVATIEESEQATE